MGGLDLSDRDVQAMLRVTARHGDDAGDGEVLPVLPVQLLHDLRDLIACDHLSVSGQDTPRRRTFAGQLLADGPLPSDAPPEELFWAHYWESLPCSYPDRTGDLVSVTMASDFYSLRALHDTGMYVDYLGPFGVERELMVVLPSGPGRTLRLLFSRGPGPDFTERDRALLTLLRPHLQAAYVTAERRRLGQAPLTARQREILQYVAAGLTNDQIGRRLAVSPGTVRKHLENVFARLDVTSRTAAVARADLDDAGPAGGHIVTG